MNRDEVVVTGWALRAPGIASWQQLRVATAADLCGSSFDAAAEIGRKGLRFKDEATRLALCVGLAAMAGVDAALVESTGGSAKPRFDSGLGVVVSSNLGNLDTTCRVASTIHSATASETSAMDLPNASSNVIAASLAIRLGAGAVNLMVCNGASSGADALNLASVSLRAGRAERVLVVGVETRNEVVERLEGTHAGPPFVPVAAALVLERRAAARARGVEPRARLGEFVWHPSFAAARRWAARHPNLGRWSVPASAELGDLPATLAGVVEPVVGAAAGAYGAKGIIQAIALAQWLRDQPRAQALVSCGAEHGDDNVVSFWLHAATPEES